MGWGYKESCSRGIPSELSIKKRRTGRGLIRVVKQGEFLWVAKVRKSGQRILAN